jgi:transposase
MDDGVDGSAGIDVPNLVLRIPFEPSKEPSTMNTIMIGLDIAKNVFHAHSTDHAGAVSRRRLRRAELERYFGSLPPAVVGMEACAGAHHWARTFERMGHEVRLMPPSYVKPYVKRNKTDGRDAEAIWEAMQRPTMRFVAVKCEEQQAVLVLHRTHSLLTRQRTMLANTIRATFAEFGIVAAQGVKGLGELIGRLAPGDCPIPELACAALLMMAGQWKQLDGEVRALEQRIVRAARCDANARKLMAVPGIGPITASALVATVADPRVFRTARGFAAWIGLTPRQHGTGGKTRSGAISKRGDRYLRKLLITGASAQLRYACSRGTKDPWLCELMARRPYKIVAVALAAKTARIVWAMLACGQDYRARLAIAA